MATFTYDASQHFLVIGGFPINGFQDGSSITIEYDEARMTRQVDIDGKNVTFNKTNNKLGTVTFTLNEGAAGNDFLSALEAAFDNGTGGVAPFFFKDNNGRSVALSDSCTVMTSPGIGGGRESTGRQWVLGTGQMTKFVGGAEATI